MDELERSARETTAVRILLRCDRVVIDDGVRYRVSASHARPDRVKRVVSPGVQMAVVGKGPRIGMQPLLSSAFSSTFKVCRTLRKKKSDTVACLRVCVLSLLCVFHQYSKITSIIEAFVLVSECLALFSVSNIIWRIVELLLCEFGRFCYSMFTTASNIEMPIEQRQIEFEI